MTHTTSHFENGLQDEGDVISARASARHRFRLCRPAATTQPPRYPIRFASRVSRSSPTNVAQCGQNGPLNEWPSNCEIGVSGTGETKCVREPTRQRFDA